MDDVTHKELLIVFWSEEQEAYISPITDHPYKNAFQFLRHLKDHEHLKE